MAALMNDRRVLVLSPSDFSLYTLATVASLHRAGVTLAGVGVLRLLNPRRLISEHRRDGARLLKKVWTKLLRRNSGFRTDGQETIPSFLRENTIPLERVSAFCRRESIPLRFSYGFNRESFVEWVREQDPTVIVFTGGGLIRAPLLSAAPLGVLNCHMGKLPAYRGMDLPEWAILNDEFDQLGCCVHVMNSGVDTGPILRNYDVPLQPGDDIRRLRQRIEYTMCTALVETTLEYLSGDVVPLAQAPEDGRQLFIMAPALVDVVQARLKTRGRAGSEPSSRLPQ